MTSIGMLELNSIARGIESADAMLKAGESTLLFSKPVCPGKYIILIHGDVDAVKASVAAGAAIGGRFVVSHLIIPSVNQQVIKAINATAEAPPVGALGVIEYFDVISSITGADAAVKAAMVELIEIRLGMGIAGKSFFTCCGDVSAVKSVISAAQQYAVGTGTIISSCVIPSPSPELFRQLL